MVLRWEFLANLPKFKRAKYKSRESRESDIASVQNTHCVLLDLAM